MPNMVKIWAEDIWIDNCMPHITKADIRTSYKGVDSGFCIPIGFFKEQKKDAAYIQEVTDSQL